MHTFGGLLGSHLTLFYEVKSVTYIQYIVDLKTVKSEGKIPLHLLYDLCDLTSFCNFTHVIVQVVDRIWRLRIKLYICSVWISLHSAYSNKGINKSGTDYQLERV